MNQIDHSLNIGEKLQRLRVILHRDTRDGVHELGLTLPLDLNVPVLDQTLIPLLGLLREVEPLLGLNPFCREARESSSVQ